MSKNQLDTINPVSILDKTGSSTESNVCLGKHGKESSESSDEDKKSSGHSRPSSHSRRSTPSGATMRTTATVTGASTEAPSNTTASTYTSGGAEPTTTGSHSSNISFLLPTFSNSL